MTQASNIKIANRVSGFTMIGNLLLSAFKLFAGIFAHSAAMLSDAVHSASDLFSTIIVMVGVNISGKKADKEHPYGHERFECIAALFLAISLLATGIGIGYSGIRTVVLTHGAPPVPGLLALIAAIVSIAVKEGMYWYTRAAAKKIDSDALMADAWHHRTDALSSIGSLVGIAGARLGVPILDPIAALLICLMILRAGWNVAKDAVNKLNDTAVDEAVSNAIRDRILQQPGVERLDLLMTRSFASSFYVDVEIAVDGTLPLYAAHEIAQRVHDDVEAGFPRAKHVMVHVNPFDKTPAPKETQPD